MSPELMSVILTQQTDLSKGASVVDIWRMVMGAGFVVQLVMFILLMFSVISWAIIIYKVNQLGKARRHSHFFLDLFWRSRSLANIYTECRSYGYSPLAQIFQVGYEELTRLRKTGVEKNLGMDNLDRALRRASMAEYTRLSRAISFLATTGNATPFIGCSGRFGGSWGLFTTSA